jgi:hypothetical protein
MPKALKTKMLFKKNKDFKFCIGIDQTGAVDVRGRPKPLPATILDCRKNLLFKTDLKLSGLRHHELIDLICSHFSGFKSTDQVLVCVDSVFGLPESLQVKPQEVFSKIKNYHFQNKAYGATVAHSFFTQFLKSHEIPQRSVEQKVKANSVFKLKPFQKNISCGSFRVLKDLSEDLSWFSLWPFEKPTQQFVIAEGYPSYFWKVWIGAKHRDLNFLHNKFGIQLDSADSADSFVLAYGSYLSRSQIFLPTNNRLASKEGWILGVDFN